MGVPTYDVFADIVEGRNERVLLVIDGDNIISAVKRELGGIGINWRKFRELLPQACIKLHEAAPGYKLHHKVGRVTEAHFFRTIVPLPDQSDVDYQAQCRIVEKAMRRAGYVPHITRAPRGRPGYPDSDLKDLIDSRILDFDTFIVVSCDNDFWGQLWNLRNQYFRRVFYVGVESSTSKWRVDNKLPFVDIVKVLIDLSQIIEPRRSALTRWIPYTTNISVTTTPITA